MMSLSSVGSGPGSSGARGGTKILGSAGLRGRDGDASVRFAAAVLGTVILGAAVLGAAVSEALDAAIALCAASRMRSRKSSSSGSLPLTELTTVATRAATGKASPGLEAGPVAAGLDSVAGGGIGGAHLRARLEKFVVGRDFQ